MDEFIPTASFPKSLFLSCKLLIFTHISMNNIVCTSHVNIFHFYPFQITWIFKHIQLVYSNHNGIEFRLPLLNCIFYPTESNRVGLANILLYVQKVYIRHTTIYREGHSIKFHRHLSDLCNMTSHHKDCNNNFFLSIFDVSKFENK